MANVGDSGCLRLSRRTPSPGGATAIAAVAAAVPVKSSRASDSSGVVGAGSTSRRRKRGAAERSLLGTGETTTGGGRGRLVAERLSRDHKPESKGELERIQAAGGIVFPLPNRDASSGGEGDVAGATFTPAAGCDQRLMTVRDFRAGVPRVWAGGNGPGLAMSRSIGDKVRVRYLYAIATFVLGASVMNGIFAFLLFEQLRSSCASRNWNRYRHAL